MSYKGFTEPLTDDAKTIWKEHRNPTCTACPLYKNGAAICMFGNGYLGARGMIVMDGPAESDLEEGFVFSGVEGGYLKVLLSEVGLDPSDVWMTYATRCLSPYFPNHKTKDLEREKVMRKARKACNNYLRDEIYAVRPKVILAMGPDSYYHFTHKNGGIYKNRGDAFEHELYGVTVIPTVSPQQVFVKPAYNRAFVADLEKFAKMVREDYSEPPLEIIEVTDLKGVDAMMVELREDRGMLTFDVETRGLVDFLPEWSKMWCVALCKGRRNSKGELRVFSVPLEHPDAQWATEEELTKVVEVITKFVLESGVNGHNVKYDVRHMKALADRFGVEYNYVY